MPLSGLRVVTLEQAVAAPFCSRQLADFGADVVKVERPDGGDSSRGYDSVISGQSAYFAWLNRGKRSVVLDLKDRTGHDLCARLIARSDIFVHNLAPGAVERLGFGYDDVAALDPRIIWCGISGYGPNGPFRDRKAYDLLVQAESGVISITGSRDEPAKVGISIADISAGMYAFSSIMTALYARHRTGAGDRIDISMLECLTEWMMPPLYVWHGARRVVTREGVRHHMVVPYGAYRCADGLVMLAVQNDREWRRFCGVVLEDEALAVDARYHSNALRVENRAELEALIEERFSMRPRAELRELLERADIPTASLNGVQDIVAHAQHAARGRWTNVQTPSGPIPAFVPPQNISRHPPRMGAVPALGEHTYEVLAELGIR